MQTIYHREKGWSPIYWDFEFPREAFILSVVSRTLRGEGHDLIDTFKRLLVLLCGEWAEGRQEWKLRNQLGSYFIVKGRDSRPWLRLIEGSGEK